MNAPTRRGRLLRFSVFELDLDSGELFKQGRKVKLQGQPFEVLLALIERPGAVISREELKQKVWPLETAGDFDQGLNRAVNKVRDALGDSAENPHFVETLPRRGYRFISSIQEDSIRQTEPVEPSTTEAPIRTSRPSQRTWLIAVAAAALALFAAASLYFHRTQKLTDRDTIVLADFINTTGDPVFDSMLRQGLAVQLEQSPFLSLVSEGRIQRTLPLMGQPTDARLTPEIARQICERTASAAVLEGSIASLGSQYVLGLRAKNCRTGDVLDEEQVQAARKEDVLNALSQIAHKFRTRIGESLTTIKQHDTPLAEATTPSLDALKAYSAGRQVFFSKGSAAALRFFKRAIEIDPNFAMAYAYLGQRYGELGESDLSAENISKAYQLRDRTSDAEKLYITASYDLRVTGNLEKAQKTCELWAQTYPREMLAHGFEAGIVYTVAGKYEKAVEESKEAIDLDPEVPIAWDVLAYSYVSLDRLGDAANTIQRASERKLDSPYFLPHLYDIAFLQSDKAGMEREAALGERKPGVEDEMAYHEALALASSGHLQQARRMSERAVDLAQHTAQRETAALYKTGAALWDAFTGNAPEARRSAKAALELSDDREVEYGAAVALALSGDSSQAQTLTNDLEKRFAEDTSVKFSYVPTLRAIVELKHGVPLKAIDLLEIASPSEMGQPRSSIHGSFGALYPVYVRGEAYLAAHKDSEAAREFQKILDHRGIVVSDPIGALAHLQIGRAFALSGDKNKARIAYQRFLNMWKGADPDIPILKLAQVEYARL